jgi:hypothetical protein
MSTEGQEHSQWLQPKIMKRGKEVDAIKDCIRGKCNPKIMRRDGCNQ